MTAHPALADVSRAFSRYHAGDTRGGSGVAKDMGSFETSWLHDLEPGGGCAGVGWASGGPPSGPRARKRFTPRMFVMAALHAPSGSPEKHAIFNQSLQYCHQRSRKAFQARARGLRCFLPQQPIQVCQGLRVRGYLYPVPRCRLPWHCTAKELLQNPVREPGQSED